MTPKIVFAGTAIAAMISVSLKAWIVSAAEIASQAAPNPFSNVRQKTSASGPSSTTSR